MGSYICHTSYHMLIALCKLEHPRDHLVLCDMIATDNDRLFQLKKHRIHYQLLEEVDKRSFWDNDIYIFNDWTQIGEYFRKNHINYHLIEDGLNCHQFPLYRLHMSTKRRLFNAIFGIDNRPFGYSKYCQSIEVNDMSLISKDQRYSKLVEISRKELFLSLSKERKQLILDVFGVTPIPYQERKSVLVLTQPLFKDQFDSRITSQEAQIAFYQTIVDKYKKDYKIYFKVHPRDDIDYSSIKDVEYLARTVPMELYEFIGDYTFEIGITHSSTALDFLECVKKKIHLVDLKKEKRNS